MSKYDQAVAAIRSPLPAEPGLRDLVRFATLAPNSHNTQPWTFRLEENAVEIRPDFSRRCPVVDPDDHHLYVTLGCAAENLAIAANAGGRPADVTVQANGPRDFSVRVSLGHGVRSDERLCAAIPERQSTKSEYDGAPLSASESEALRSAAAGVPGSDLVFVSDRQKLEESLLFIQQGNSAQIDDSAFVSELRDWIRFNPASALKTGDGLLGMCSGSPSAPDWLGPTIFTLAFKKGTENKKLARQLRSSAGIAVFVAEQESPEGWIAVGRSFERFALQGTALGIRHSHVNMPIEVPAVRPAFADWLGIAGGRPDLVIRFGKAAPMPMSIRRPLDDVIEASGS
jgi:hypothetical protein